MRRQVELPEKWKQIFTKFELYCMCSSTNGIPIAKENIGFHVLYERPNRTGHVTIKVIGKDGNTRKLENYGEFTANDRFIEIASEQAGTYSIEKDIPDFIELATGHCEDILNIWDQKI